jgi:hypothetical protein
MNSLGSSSAGREQLLRVDTTERSYRDRSCLAFQYLWLSATLLGVVSGLGLQAQTTATTQQQEQQNTAKPSQELKPPATGTQTPGGPTNAVDPNALKAHWIGSITAGFQFSRGQTNANGVSVMGDAQYGTAKRGYRFEGVLLYARVRVPLSPGVTQQFTAQDRRNAYITFYQQIHGPVFLLSRASVEHDVLSDVRIRGLSLTGIGVFLADSQRFQLLVAPGLGFGYEDKPNVREGGVFTPGVYQRMNWHITRIWSLDEWFQYRSSVSNSHDYFMTGTASVTGLIYKKLGFNLGYLYSYEGLVGIYGGNVVPQPPFRLLSQMTIGLRFTI